MSTRNHISCPILEAEGLVLDSKEGIDFCTSGECPYPECGSVNGFKRQEIEARNLEIRRLKEHNTVNQLVNRFGLSTSTINRALATANKK